MPASKMCPGIELVFRHGNCASLVEVKVESRTVDGGLRAPHSRGRRPGTFGSRRERTPARTLVVWGDLRLLFLTSFSERGGKLNMVARSVLPTWTSECTFTPPHLRIFPLLGG
nr:hypothetical protein CFP56_13169 [Quercus suber]